MGGRVQTKDLERLSTTLASRRGEALVAWTRAVRDAAHARGREPVLLDLGPWLFGPWLEEPAALEMPPGVDPAQAIEELALMREALEPLSRTEARAVGRAIAALQRNAAAQVAAAQDQGARFLDRVLGAPDLESLLAALLESAPAIDFCALYASRPALERRAVAGLARDLPVAPDALVQLAARKGTTTSVRDASSEPLLEGSPTAASGLRTVTAFPLVERGALAGVLEAGSRTAFELGRLDQTLLRAAAARAGPLLVVEAAATARGDGAAAPRDELSVKDAILASCLDAFVALGPQRRILEWNAAAERIFGWTRAEVLGRSLDDVIVPARMRSTDADTLRRALADDHRGDLGRRTEMPAMHRDGHEFPVELAVTRVDLPTGAVFTVALRDITDRKRLERASRRMTQTFEALIDASPLAIVAHDAEGRVIIWNRAAEEVSGWQRSEVIGQPDPFLPADARHEAQALGTNGSGTHVIALEASRARKDGALVDLSISLAPLRTGRRAAPGTIAIAADITEKKRAQTEAAETARFREQFVGIVGHDLRNPLSAILTAAQLLLRTGLSDRQARTGSRIVASAERMTRMIADLLDFTRSRLGGGFPITTRRMNLRELCETVIEELELAYPERTIELEARGDAWGSWDPDRMAQVVSNLAGNALQHSPESSTVRVELRDEGERVVLQTSNAGPPIPPEVLPHLFEPGRRGVPGRGHKESSGLGLGLYIVRQIVLAHGGDIAVRSSATEGTTFTLWLPRRSRLLP